jgi:hypothetical protein
MWEKGDEDGVCPDGIVISFCRTFMSKEFMDECSRRVNRELSKLLATHNGICLHNDDGVFETSEETFEETFKDSCFFLQLLLKLPQYACTHSEIDEEHSQALCADFLNGYASHFARRVTEYCLIKHGIEDSPFSYTMNEDSCNDHLICYTRVDTTVRSFPPNFLSCHGKNTDPNQLLHEMLPGNAAIAIIEMWQLIGKYNSLEDREEKVISLSVIDAFIKHIEESCL